MIALKLMPFNEKLVRTERVIFNVSEYQDLIEDFSKRNIFNCTLLDRVTDKPNKSEKRGM